MASMALGPHQVRSPVGELVGFDGSNLVLRLPGVLEGNLEKPLENLYRLLPPCAAKHKTCAHLLMPSVPSPSPRPVFARCPTYPECTSLSVAKSKTAARYRRFFRCLAETGL